MPAVETSLADSAKPSPGFLDSSVGKKVVMAVTGIMLFGFVTVHMLGNMQAYMGAEPMNHYAEFLQTMIHGAGIWVFRAVMLTAVVLPRLDGPDPRPSSQLAARPVGYRAQQLKAATLASRTMRWTGLDAGHLHRLPHPAPHHRHHPPGDFVRGNAYQNLVSGLQVRWVAAFYIVAQLCLGFHMWHGVWSLTQTLGWAHPALQPPAPAHRLRHGHPGGGRQHFVPHRHPHWRHPPVEGTKVPWN